MSIFSIVLDIALIFLILLITFLSYRKGFAISALSLAAWMAAIIIASFLSKPIAEFAYDSFKGKLLGETVTQLSDKEIVIDDSLQERIELIYNSLPEFTSEAISYLGIDPEKAADDIRQSFPIRSSVTIEDVLDMLIKPSIISLLEAISLIVLFIILLPLLKMLAKMISKLFDIPVVSSFNRILGGVLGIVKSIIVIMILSVAIHIFITATNDKNQFINTDILNSSRIFSFIDEKNPLL